MQEEKIITGCNYIIDTSKLIYFGDTFCIYLIELGKLVEVVAVPLSQLSALLFCQRKMVCVIFFMLQSWRDGGSLSSTGDECGLHPYASVSDGYKACKVCTKCQLRYMLCTCKMVIYIVRSSLWC